MSNSSRPYNRVRDVRLGLEIFERHGELNVAAEHDIFYGASSNIELTDEERAMLEDYGWFIDESCDAWAFFV